MPKSGKKYTAAAKQIEPRPYLLNEAVPLVQKIKFAKFDETLEVHMRLGVDPKHADQMVRGTVVLPNGLGRSKKVLVITSGDKQREAREAGADIVGGEEIVNKIQSEGWVDFDRNIVPERVQPSPRGRRQLDLGPTPVPSDDIVQVVVVAEGRVRRVATQEDLAVLRLGASVLEVVD